VHPRVTFSIDTPLQPADIARCVRFILTQPPHVRIPVMMVCPGDQPM
jgi:NADP-dependent 3-hydroxy acid dehydrogenase YdfG